MWQIALLLWGIAIGAALNNIRYYFLLKKKPLNMVGTRHFKPTHFRGETTDGHKFVYCPIGNICSWSIGDYDHKWCHFCQIFFGEKVAKLLNPDEKHLKAK